jgi:hypothetical protein
MELTDLAHRISNLERQLAASRWRERAVCASAILIGLVFACRSSTATDDKPPPEAPKRLVIGGVTIDERGIAIDGLAASITLTSGADRRTRITAGDLVLGSFEGATPRIQLQATGSMTRIEAVTGKFRAEMSTTEQDAGVNVSRAMPLSSTEMRLTETSATVVAWSEEATARAEIKSRVGGKSVRMITENGKPELAYEK